MAMCSMIIKRALFLMRSEHPSIMYRNGSVILGPNQLSSMLRRRMWKWRYNLTILNLNTRWRFVVGFTPRPLYFWGRSPRYPLVPVWTLWSRDISPAPTGNLPTIAQPAAHRYTDWAVLAVNMYSHNFFRSACSPSLYRLSCPSWEHVFT
jgi:hypothetical protein